MADITLNQRFMYYAGILAAAGANTDDLKHISDLLEAEEQGKLPKLPCKVGDTVYRILDNIYEFEVTCIRLYEDKMLLDIENSDIRMGFSLDANRFTKNLFLTYEEAEKALEMEKKNGNSI